MRRLPGRFRIGLATAVAAALGGGVVVVGVIAEVGPERPRPVTEIGADGVSLVAFDSCDTALRELRNNALPQVGPYGLTPMHGVPAVDGAGEGGAAAPPGAQRDLSDAAGKSAERAQDHSTTNTHEAGVDEPDLVKTDGTRLVTVVDGTLRVIDVASRAVTATLRLPAGTPGQLLLHGDRALVLSHPGAPPVSRKPMPGAGNQSQLVLVDLSSGARVLSTLEVDGAYLDARQNGSVARVVVRSTPRLEFTYPTTPGSEAAATRRNQEIVRNSSIQDWLPHYVLTTSDGAKRTGEVVECAAVHHPRTYTGASMLTVLSIDLAAELSAKDAVSIAADGDTVYGTATSLYVADDHRPHTMLRDLAPGPAPAEQGTEIYQFDISAPGKPVYVASGSVDGTLLNQYSLSEFQGHLRIATTEGETCCGESSGSESAVTVLARRGDTLATVGRVGGLGAGERIYAVRFLGPIGYVVTFRQTDPLYTVDLTDPAKPTVTGALKITGYSAYLHSVGDGRLLGVGQEATPEGMRTGTQVSLFDTTDLAAPRRVGQFHLPNSNTEAEYDPHAFLFWPARGLVVLPVLDAMVDGGAPTGGALVLRLDGDRLTEVGTVDHPGAGQQIRRSLVIGDGLWTVSAAGIQVNDLTTLAEVTWLPFG